MSQSPDYNTLNCFFLFFYFYFRLGGNNNSVRKVELHMKYIRLTQMLEWKAREYQEVCAREKTLISRMTK